MVIPHSGDKGRIHIDATTWNKRPRRRIQCPSVQAGFRSNAQPFSLCIGIHSSLAVADRTEKRWLCAIHDQMMRKAATARFMPFRPNTLLQGLIGASPGVQTRGIVSADTLHRKRTSSSQNDEGAAKAGWLSSNASSPEQKRCAMRRRPKPICR
jgi:hypothetical protein